MEKDVNTITVPKEESAPVSEKITVEVAKESGLTPEEIELAKKEGMIEEETPDPDKTEKTDKSDKVEKTDKTETPEKKDKPAKTEKPELPSQEEAMDDPEKEHILIEHFRKDKQFGSEAIGLYFDKKKERKKRQNAEAERDQILLQNKLYQKELEESKKRIADIEARLSAKPKDKDGKDGDLDFLLDDDKPKEGKDANDKPLTHADLERIEKEKAEKAEKERRESKEKALAISRKLDVLQIDAKSRYQDWDAVTDLANEIIKSPEKVFGNNQKQITKARQKVITLMYMIENVDAFKDGDYNATDVAYEIGQLHPNYKPANSNGSKNAERDRTLTPEQLKKIEENSRRTSSASLADGGADETVSVNDITPEQAARLSTAEFQRLPKDVRERLLKEVA